MVTGSVKIYYQSPVCIQNSLCWVGVAFSYDCVKAAKIDNSNCVALCAGGCDSWGEIQAVQTFCIK